MLEIELTQAETQLTHLIEIAGKGEEVVITKASQPVAKLVAVGRCEGDLQLGSAAGLITFSEDFDEPLEDFAEYR
jgi:prevent-host-death family protein